MFGVFSVAVLRNGEEWNRAGLMMKPRCQQEAWPDGHDSCQPTEQRTVREVPLTSPNDSGTDRERVPEINHGQ